MAQSTLVVVLPPGERQALRQRLPAAEFEFRTVPHALFSAKGREVVATLYRSGKLVVQGRDPELFLERYVGDAARPAPKGGKTGDPPADSWIAAGRTVVGSDECGKGDYFGPLVVCAVRLEPGLADKLAASGVADSKKLSDERALRLGGALRAYLPHAIRRLDPPEYNARYGRVGQLNHLLADLHAEAIRELAAPGDSVLVDRFASAELLERRLAGLEVELVQRVRAEAHPAVAAASVIAREEFLTALRELSDELAVPLHKGAGAPVDEVAVELVRLHGREALGRAAKLHFKNTAKLERRLG